MSPLLSATVHLLTRGKFLPRDWRDQWKVCGSVKKSHPLFANATCRRVFSRVSTDTSSGCCCCVASTSSVSLRASANVAVHLILVLAQAGVLGTRGYAVEMAATRICREASARVRTNVLVKDMDLGAPVHDNRRLEILAEGLPLCGGVQLAMDTTLVNPPLQWVRPSRHRSD